MKRRDIMTFFATGGLLAYGSAVQPASEGGRPRPWEWMERRGIEEDIAGTPLQFMPSRRDAQPLEDELEKFPLCPYCGMSRGHEKWRYTRHLIHYVDDSVDPTCSIHCAALSLGLNLDLVPKGVYGADAGSDRVVPPLLEVEKLRYVIDPGRPGTMTRRSKSAYADLEEAREAAGSTGELASFDQALRAAYADMAEDTILIRRRRAEKRQ